MPILHIFAVLALLWGVLGEHPSTPTNSHTFSTAAPRATNTLASARSLFAPTSLTTTPGAPWQAADLDNSSYSNPVTRGAAKLVAGIRNGFARFGDAITRAREARARQVDMSILRRAAHIAGTRTPDAINPPVIAASELADYYGEHTGSPQLVTDFWGDNPHYERVQHSNPNSISHWRDLAEPRPRPSPIVRSPAYRAEVVPSPWWDFGWDAQPAMRYVPAERAAKHEHGWVPALPSAWDRVRAALSGGVCNDDVTVGDNAVIHREKKVGTAMGWDGAKHPIYKTEVQYVHNPFAPMSLIDAEFYRRDRRTEGEAPTQDATARLPVRPPTAYPEGQVVEPALSRLMGSFWREGDVHTHSQSFRDRLQHALTHPVDAASQPLFVPFRTQDIDYGKQAYAPYARHLTGLDVLRACVQTLTGSGASMFQKAAVVSHLTTCIACAVFIVYHFTHVRVARGKHLRGASAVATPAATQGPLPALRGHLRRHKLIYSMLAVVALTFLNVCTYAVAPLLLYVSVVEFLSGVSVLTAAKVPRRQFSSSATESPLQAELDGAVDKAVDSDHALMWKDGLLRVAM